MSNRTSIGLDKLVQWKIEDRTILVCGGNTSVFSDWLLVQGIMDAENLRRILLVDDGAYIDRFVRGDSNHVIVLIGPSSGSLFVAVERARKYGVEVILDERFVGV